IRLGNIGIVYHNQGDYPKALEYYFKALQMDEELGDKAGIAAAFGNIGLIYSDQGDYSKALEYCYKALKMDEEMGLKSDMAMNLSNIGNFHSSQGDYSKGLEYYFKALKMNENLGNKNGIARELGNIGSICTQTGRFAEAEVYLDSALAMSESIGTLSYIKNQHQYLSDLYDTTAQLTACGVNLTGFKNLSGLWRKALMHYKKYATAKDSLFNEEKSKDIGRLEQKHEFEMAEMARMQEEQERIKQMQEAVERRNLLQYSLIVIGLMVIGLSVSVLGRFNLSTRMVEAIVFISFLIFFEFLLVLLDPYIESWSGGEPLWKLLANAILAAAIFPVHGFFEDKVKKRVAKVEKDRRPKSEDRSNKDGGNSGVIKALLLISLIIAQTTHLPECAMAFAGGQASTGSNTDSLKAELKKDLSDTTRVKVLNKLGWQLMYQNPDTAIFLAKQALSILYDNDSEAKQSSATKRYLQKLTANSYSHLGAYYYLKGDYPLSLSHHFKALKIRETQKDRKGIATSLGNIGIVYYDQGDYPKTLDYYFKVLETFKELGNESGVAKVIGNIGLVYWNQGDYPKALEYYFKALKMKEKLGDKTEIAITTGNIGIVYYSQGDYPKTLEYYFKALKIIEELGNKSQITTLLGNIGIIYAEQGDYPKALDYYFKVLKMDEELGNKNGIARHFGNIGIVYVKQQDYPKALEYYFRALKMDEELGLKSDIASDLGNIGFLYTQTGLFEKAEVYLDSALRLFDNIGELNFIAKAHQSLSNLYDTTGRIAYANGNRAASATKYKLALTHFKKYTNTKDSLFNEEKAKDIGRLEQKHEFEMAELVRIQEEQERSKQMQEAVERRNLLQYSLIVIGLMVIGLSLSVLGRFNLSVRMVEAIVFISFLIFFEFLLVLLDPYLEQLTGGEPLWKLLANAILAAAIFPVHSFFEDKVKKRVAKVEKDRSGESEDRSNNDGGNSDIIKIFLLVSLIVVQSISTGSKIDSLKVELKKDLSDTTRIKVLNILAGKFMYQNPDTAIILSTIALKLAEQEQWQKAIANTARNLGVFNDIKGNYPEALNHYFTALIISEELNDLKGNAVILGNIGIVYRNQGNYPKALEYYFNSLKIKEESGNNGGIALTQGNIGLVYSSQGNYPKALEYYFKALKMDEEFGRKRGMAFCLSNIGIVYAKQDKHAKALDYFFKALKMMKELGNKNGIAAILGNVGNVYTSQEDYPKALESFFKALKMDKELGSKEGIASDLGNIGSLYTRTGHIAEAEHYLDSALALSKRIGAVYITMNFEKSISYLYDTTARYKQALTHYKKYTIAKDSLFNEEKAKDIGRLEQKHEIEMAELKRQQEEEARMRQLEAEVSRRNSLQYSLIVIGLIVIALVISMLARFNVSTKVAEAAIFIAFLIFFEFILVLLDPSIEQYTNGEPGWKLLVNAVLAGAIFPVHQYFEKKMKKRLGKRDGLDI
ncbi:tetratricopeptide repeat protein, partial [bacterium AH-315-C07]|nr:tetratricopeptide repeat protein [bacterium AH-315-C07]